MGLCKLRGASLISLSRFARLQLSDFALQAGHRKWALSKHQATDFCQISPSVQQILRSGFDDRALSAVYVHHMQPGIIAGLPSKEK